MQNYFPQISVTCLQWFILCVGWKDAPRSLGFLALRRVEDGVQYVAVVAQVNEEEEDNHASEGHFAESHPHTLLVYTPIQRQQFKFTEVTPQLSAFVSCELLITARLLRARK